LASGAEMRRAANVIRMTEARGRVIAKRTDLPEHWATLHQPHGTGAKTVAIFDVEQASREHFARIHRAALVLTGNPWDADDLAQETFLVMARRAAEFQGRSALYTWLYGILLNLERRERRRSGVHRRKLRVLWDQEPAHEPTTPAAEAPIEVAEWKKSLWAHVAKLPEGQRQALVLRFSEFLPYEEIAVVLDCPLGTVKSRIFNGLATLRTMIAGEHGSLRETPRHPYEDLTHAV
jgi:RNA polymerase sigma-70 factor (ECF subfamily)